jgi:hypothetical protein
VAERRIRLLLAGTWGPGALERAYAGAFEQAGCEVLRFDLFSLEQRFVRLGAPGRFFNRFVPVEPWIRKANRQLILEARSFRPDVIVVVGQIRVLAGALAQALLVTRARAVCIWPDTLLHLGGERIDALPLYDLVASYSRDSVPLFERLGARHAAWVPLAGEPAAAREPEAGPLAADVSFIGQWRPEREAALGALLDGLPGRDVKIWGPDWGRRARGRVRAAWQGRSLFGEEFARAVASSKVNLNVIDDTNFPAPNNRFFEIPCLGGLQLSSACPEMEDEFQQGRDICYYREVGEIPDLVRNLLADETHRAEIARAGAEKARAAHTWGHRVRQILDLAGLSR